MVKIQGNELLPTLESTNSTLDTTKYLQEHADYERKALEYTMAIIGKFPEKMAAIEPLSQIALGSMTIFADLCTIMVRRGIPLMPESPQNLYLKQIAWLGRSVREERFMDRVLLGSIAEKRCAVRFAQIANLVDDAELMVFYQKCAAHKEHFSKAYMHIAQQNGPQDIVAQRLAALTVEEEKIMSSMGNIDGIF